MTIIYPSNKMSYYRVLPSLNVTSPSNCGISKEKLKVWSLKELKFKNSLSLVSFVSMKLKFAIKVRQNFCCSISGWCLDRAEVFSVAEAWPAFHWRV